MKVKFIAITAHGKNREIGLKGKLPWDLPEEYAHYKKIVKNHFVLVGRKNFEANGSDIEGSRAIVLSRNEYSHPKAEIVCHSMTEVVEFAEKNSIHTIYVIGGSEIYQLTLPYLSEFLCSVVDYEGPADTFFPEYRFYEWEVIRQEVHHEWSLYHLKKTPDF